MAAPWRKVFPGTWQPSEAAFSTRLPGKLISESMLGAATGGAVSGTLGTSTPAPTVAASGSVTVSGSLSVTVPSPTVTITAKVTVSGSLALTIPSPTFAASGSISAAGITGTLTVTTPGPVFALSGAILSQGALTLTAPSPTVAGSGSVTVTGSTPIATPGPVLSGSGKITVSGTLSLATPDPILAAAGSIGSAGLSGTLDTATPSPALAGSGSLAVTGTMARTIPAPAFEALGAILTPLVGTLAVTIDAPAFTAQGSSGTVQDAGGYSIPRHAAQAVNHRIQGELVASLPAPVVKVFGNVQPIQIEQPRATAGLPDYATPANTRQTSIVPQESSIEAVPLATRTPIAIQIQASTPAPSLALTGSVIHEAALAVALGTPTFQALGEVEALPYDDSEDLLIALMMLEAA